MKKGNGKIKRILSVTAAAACMLSAIRLVPFNGDNAAAAETLSAFEITQDMKIGWNIGNSLDATVSGSTATVDSEIAWGNPKVTQELIDAIKAKGFNTVRIPTTWYQHLDENNNIDPAWLARVHEVVDYCYKNDMYIILNLHHENWVNRADLGTAYEEMKVKLLDIWQQLADEFSDYDQRLIFECMNEPRAVGTEHEWWGPLQSEVDTINQLNADFVELIRNDDSPYADTRLLMIPGYCASSDISMISKIKVPEDDYIAVSIHAYSPYAFTMDKTVADHSVFTAAYRSELLSILEGIRSTFIENDVPVVIGEFSASNYDNTEARCEWAECYISTTKKYGIPCVLWDNDARGNSDKAERHDYINRDTYEWYEDSVQVVDTMMSVLADSSIVWGSEGKGPEYVHSSIDSGKTLSTKSESIDASVTGGNCTGNYDVSWSALEGKEIAVQYTGDTPLACFMDSAWGNWTQINPYTIDKDKGIAYYSYDDIKAAWSGSSEPAHLCCMTMGTTTVTKIALIDAAEVKDPSTDPTDPTNPTNPTDPTDPTTPTDDDFVFETKVYDISLADRTSEEAEVVFTVQGEPGASIGGCVGYGTNADDWVNIEWSSTVAATGEAEITVDISEIPMDFAKAQIQIWWSTLAKVDYPCELADYEIVNNGSGDVTTTEPPVLDYEYGDANLDGVVNITDVIAIMIHCSTPGGTLDIEAIVYADVYQKGDNINNMDALAVQKKIAQLIPSLPESYM